MRSLHEHRATVLHIQWVLPACTHRTAVRGSPGQRRKLSSVCDFNRTLVYLWLTVLIGHATRDKTLCCLVDFLFFAIETLQADWIQDGHSQRLMPFRLKVRKPSTGFSDGIKCDAAERFFRSLSFFKSHQATSRPVAPPECFQVALMRCDIIPQNKCLSLMLHLIQRQTCFKSLAGSES